MKFIADFNVRRVLLEKNIRNGERVIANLYQLIELVHKIQNNKDFSPLELVSWLQRGMEGMEMTGDEFEQRVESDEDAIKILTIHKSKGLEYNIVFAPFLDMVFHKEAELFSYRDPVTGEYISIEKDKVKPEQEVIIKEQAEQENRRLVYVAITRAVYKCYLFHSDHHSANDSSLNAFLKVMDFSRPNLVAKTDALEIPKAPRAIRSTSVAGVVETPQNVSFSLRERNWTKMSYTMLAKKGEIVSRIAAAPQQDAYDDFIFKQLTRGSKTGNLLHEIFENISFSHETSWEKVIGEALGKHIPARQETFAPFLLDMLRQTIYLPLKINGSQFSLSEVSPASKINEFEFDFLVDQYNPAELNALSDESIDVRVGWDTPLQGILNGKMDLFFGHNNKYYILDWKSNYLGDTLEDYSSASLAAAMSENNYHLQYLIYALAAKKYLSVRLKNFNYERDFGGIIYLFIRGVRTGGDTGIFTAVPTMEKITMLEDIIRSPIKQ